MNDNQNKKCNCEDSNKCTCSCAINGVFKEIHSTFSIFVGVLSVGMFFLALSNAEYFFEGTILEPIFTPPFAMYAKLFILFGIVFAAFAYLYCMVINHNNELKK